MTLAEFEQQIFEVALNSPLCGIPAVRRLTPTSISLRISTSAGTFIDAFYNEQTSTMAYALIHKGQRVFGADNTGGWHVHPFADPARHEPSPTPVSFSYFVAEIELHESDS